MGTSVLSVNRAAMDIVRRIMAESERLGVEVITLNNKSTVIDMGVRQPGGWEAARLFCEATLGGLGRVEFGTFDLEGLELPQVELYVDLPAVALLGSQISGWALTELKNEAGVVPLVSGPIRARGPQDMFAGPVPYRDDAEEVVAALQDNRLPNETLTWLLADRCGVPPEGVYVLVAATSSLVGSINVVARTLETAIWRLHCFGLDVNRVIAAWGRAPLPPVVRDEFEAMVRTNTFAYYGGTVGFILDDDEEKIASVVGELPLSPATCRLYGVPFRELFERAGGDIFNMEGFVHSVARVVINNVSTGKIVSAGAVDKKVLLDCLNA